MQRIDHSFNAMGGPCRVRLVHADKSTANDAIRAAETEVRRLEQKYSRYLDDSVTSLINRAAGSGQACAIDSETAGLLGYADTLWQQSDGLFDLTAGILRRAWDFKNKLAPAADELAALLPLIGWDQVLWDEQSITLPRAGMELDFGGCVKEYACDSAAGQLRQHGIEHALVDLAGDMVALGDQGKGQPWSIGIRHPTDKTNAIARISLAAAALASSGDYERCLHIDGQRYGHILNPHTGWPTQGLVAVSVIAEQCLVAGSSATIAMLKPEQEALAWLAELGLPWLGIDAAGQCHGSIHQTG
ncbi:MAG: FAD:protein FMN transferase [Halieaceae bacterium]